MFGLSKNSLILLLYSLLWFTLLYLYKRKNGRFTLCYALIAFYALLSVVTIFVFNSEYAGLYYEQELTLFPLLFLFFMMVISFVPLITLKERQIEYITIPNQLFCNFICILFGIFSLIAIIEMLPLVQTGLEVMVAGGDSITDLYQDSTEARMSKRAMTGTFSIVGVISNLSGLIGPLLLYTYLLQNKRNWIVVVLISMTIVHGFLHGIATASRAQIAFSIFSLVLLMFFFKPYLESKVIVALKRIFVAGFAVVSILLFTITVARVETQGRVSSTFNVARYLGGAPLVFDNYCMDAGGTREGYHTAPLFIQLFLGKQSLSESEKRFKFRDMKVDNSRFYTFVGDYVLDYGPTMAFLIFIVFSACANACLKHRSYLSYGQVIIVYMVLRFCSSFHQASFTGTGGNIAFVFELFLALLFSTGKMETKRIYRKNG